MWQRHPIFRRAGQLVAAIPNIEPVVLVVLVISTASLWGFIQVADEVVEGDTQAFDHWALRTLRNPENPEDPIGPRWMEEVARDITALGGLAFITIATAGIAVYLCLDRKTHMALFLVIATSTGALVSMLLKSLFARPRPDLVPHLSEVFTSSFPSGHALIAAVVYLTLGALVASVISNIWLKLYVLSVAILLTTAVGATRVYLGVHYPTDVLAGWLAGLVWALVCWSVARVLQLRGRVEKPASNKSH